MLAFSVCGQEYGVELLQVQEVLPVPPITRVYHVPPHVLGVTNLRGHVLALVDPGRLLGIGSVTAGPMARVVVVAAGDLSAGLLVEEVRGLRSIPSDQIDRTAARMSGAPAEWVKGIALLPGGPLALLDAEQLLRSARVEGR